MVVFFFHKFCCFTLGFLLRPKAPPRPPWPSSPLPALHDISAARPWALRAPSASSTGGHLWRSPDGTGGFWTLPNFAGSEFTLSILVYIGFGGLVQWSNFEGCFDESTLKVGSVVHVFFFWKKKDLVSHGLTLHRVLESSIFTGYGGDFDVSVARMRGSKNQNWQPKIPSKLKIEQFVSVRSVPTGIFLLNKNESWVLPKTTLRFFWALQGDMVHPGTQCWNLPTFQAPKTPKQWGIAPPGLGGVF